MRPLECGRQPVMVSSSTGGPGPGLAPVGSDRNRLSPLFWEGPGFGFSPGSTADEDYHLGSIWCADGWMVCGAWTDPIVQPPTKAVTVARPRRALFPCYSNDPGHVGGLSRPEAAQSQQLFRVGDGLQWVHKVPRTCLSDHSATSSLLVGAGRGFHGLQQVYYSRAVPCSPTGSGARQAVLAARLRSWDSSVH